MNKENTAVNGNPTPPTFKQKIGRTTYEVTCHFSPTAKENPRQKIERIILRAAEKEIFS